MKKGMDIYDLTKQIKKFEESLKKTQISKHNVDLILEFKDLNILNNIGLHCINRTIQNLKKFAEILNKDFDKASKEDTMRWWKMEEPNVDIEIPEWIKILKSMLKKK